jgi:hypothetical protein
MADYNANNLTIDRAFASKPAIAARLVEGPTAPVITHHYRKRAWRNSSAYVEWETTSPDGAYPGGGTLDPPLGTILYQWTTTP